MRDCGGLRWLEAAGVVRREPVGHQLWALVVTDEPGLWADVRATGEDRRGQTSSFVVETSSSSTHPPENSSSGGKRMSADQTSIASMVSRFSRTNRGRRRRRSVAQPAVVDHGVAGAEA